MSEPSPDLPDGWYSPADRVPRRGQVVRILTQGGVSHQAEFVVAYTEAWPSGASWALSNGREVLPFADVSLWSPNPDASPPGTAEAGAGPSEFLDPGTRPVILSEMLIEVKRTGELLRLPRPAQLDWSPHPDVPTLRDLSWRLVRLVERIGWILELDRFDLTFEAAVPATDDILEVFNASRRAVTQVVGGLDAAAMRATWTLEREGAAVVCLPRGDALRTFGLTPLAYYRGELAQLLTALGSPVPHPTPLWCFEESEAPGRWEASKESESEQAL